MQLKQDMADFVLQLVYTVQITGKARFVDCDAQSGDIQAHVAPDLECLIDAQDASGRVRSMTGPEPSNATFLAEAHTQERAEQQGSSGPHVPHITLRTAGRIQIAVRSWRSAIQQRMRGRSDG